MSVRKEYEEYLKRQNKLKNTKTGKFWIEQESRYVEPFCIYGNLYYVGDSWVCVHTVETGDAAGVLDTHIERLKFLLRPHITDSIVRNSYICSFII